MSSAASNTLDKVAGEFEDKSLADLQDGRAQAIAVMEAAKKDAHEEVEKVLHNGEKQAESLTRQIIGAAELDSRNAQLKSMEGAVNEAISNAINGISKVTPERYEECLQRLIEEGMAVIGQKAVIECSSTDRKVANVIIQRLSEGGVRLILSPEGIDSKGGVVLTNSDGSIRFDNTFEARLERIRPTLRKDLAAVLSRKS
jgi:V/A-type H+-transporting ATPase subunit E